MPESAKNILKKYWGYSEFRPDQKKVIEAVSAQNDVLALLPTGGGKSLCYQVPGLMNEGMCLVISPLIALMNDQVANLKSRGISAVAIHSGMNYREVDYTLENAVHHKYKFVYVSPERVQTDLFLERFKSMKVNLIAVDEAHCISQWGFDFRPSYLKLVKLRELQPQVPVLALTASAPKRIVQDIITHLELKNEQVVAGDFERPNLSYFIIKTDDVIGKTAQIVKKINAPGIVYAYTRKDTREISNWLNQQGVASNYYHAGLSSEVREKNRVMWMSNQKPVMCATNAFGMGIDKPDVKFVIHQKLPLSLEAFYQEAGRAGRDGRKAWAISFYNPGDMDDLRTRLALQFPDLAVIKRVYRALTNYYLLPPGTGINQVFPFEIAAFCKRYNMQPITVFSAIGFLEKSGYVSLSEAARTPSRLHVTTTATKLYNLQITQPHLKEVLEVLLRSYSGLFDDFVTINETQMGQRIQKSGKEMAAKFRELEKLEVLEYREQTDAPWITFTEEVVSDANLRIDPKIYHHQKELAIKRLEAVIAFVENDSECRNVQILRYFDVENPTECGICDVCSKRIKSTLTPADKEALLTQIMELLKEYTPPREIVKKYPLAQQKTISYLLNYITDNELM